jgi:LPS O-antigen subunit length determinant protein (WzzB/FepE family)
MEVNLESLGIVILVNEEQPEKALAAILVTLVGIIILVNEEQPEKALAAILITLVGIVILLVNPLQL